MLRLLSVALGLAFVAAAMAMTLPSVKRGYFIGKHGVHQVRGSFEYGFLCVMMFGVMLGGGAFVGGGLTMSREQLLHGPLSEKARRGPGAL